MFAKWRFNNMSTKDLAVSRYSVTSRRVGKTAWLRGSARWQTLENDVTHLPTLAWKKSSLEWMIECAWQRRGPQMTRGTEECCYSRVQSASMRAPYEILLYVLSFPLSLFFLTFIPIVRFPRNFRKNYIIFNLMFELHHARVPILITHIGFIEYNQRNNSVMLNSLFD